MKNSIIFKKSETELKPDGKTPCVDKNGKKYKRVGFGQNEVEFELLPDSTGRLVQTPVKQLTRTRVINRYFESYLVNQKDQPELGLNDPIGTAYFGSIVTRQVEPYFLPDNRKGAAAGAVQEVSTHTTVVFGKSTDANWENLVKAQFASDKHPLLETAPVMQVVEETTEQLPA